MQLVEGEIHRADGRVEIEVDAGTIPRGAIYAAAAAFTDRCFVRLEPGEGSRVHVRLRGKPGRSFDGDGLVAELREGLTEQAFQHRLADASGDFLRQVLAGRAPVSELAAGRAAASVGVDDLRDFDVDAGSGAEDPLALALEWEQKRAGGA